MYLQSRAEVYKLIRRGRFLFHPSLIQTPDFTHEGLNWTPGYAFVKSGASCRADTKTCAHIGPFHTLLHRVHRVHRIASPPQYSTRLSLLEHVAVNHQISREYIPKRTSTKASMTRLNLKILFLFVNPSQVLKHLSQFLHSFIYLRLKRLSVFGEEPKMDAKLKNQSGSLRYLASWFLECSMLFHRIKSHTNYRLTMADEMKWNGLTGSRM